MKGLPLPLFTASIMGNTWPCRCGLDSAKPAVDLESPHLISRLFALFHGTPPSSSLPPPNRVAPANRTLQARLMALFCKSIAAANCAPYSYQVFCSKSDVQISRNQFLG